MPYIHRDRVVSLSGLFSLGVAAGLFGFVLCVGMITTGAELLWLMCAATALLGAVGVVLVLHSCVGAYDRAGVLGMGYGLGLTALPWVGMMRSFGTEPLIPVALFSITMASGLLALATWAWMRRTTWAVHVVDEGICHRCRYELTGNTTGVCPECGTEVVDEWITDDDAGLDDCLPRAGG